MSFETIADTAGIDMVRVMGIDATYHPRSGAAVSLTILLDKNNMIEALIDDLGKLPIEGEQFKIASGRHAGTYIIDGRADDYIFEPSSNAAQFVRDDDDRFWRGAVHRK